MNDATRLIILIIVSPLVGYALLIWGIVFPLFMMVVLMVCLIKEYRE